MKDIDAQIRELRRQEINRSFDKVGQEFMITQALFSGNWEELNYGR